MYKTQLMSAHCKKELADFICSQLTAIGFDNCLIFDEYKQKKITGSGDNPENIQSFINQEILDSINGSYKLVNLTTAYHNYSIIKPGCLYISRIKYNDSNYGYLILHSFKDIFDAK